MDIQISEDFQTKIQKFRLGRIEGEVIIQIQNTDLEQYKDQFLSALSARYALEEINKIPAIEATRKAYRTLGNDPNRYRPAADALLRRIVKGNSLYTVNTLVDVLNLVSMNSGFSISAFDKQSINGEIELGIGKENEPYEGVGRGRVNINCLPVLRDQSGAFGCPTSDSTRTMIRSETTKFVFIFYDFGMHAHLESSIHTCKEMLSTYCSTKHTNTDILEFKNI